MLFRSDILEKAKKDAENIIKEAEAKANSIVEKANNDAANLKQKTEAELGMSVKQTIASLKQQLTNLISNKVAVDMTTTAFKDEDFVRELMCKIIEKWSAEGNVNLNVLMNNKEKEEFEKYLLAKHKNLLDSNLTLVTNASQKDGFVVQPKDGSYKLTFSEKVFEETDITFRAVFQKTTHKPINSCCNNNAKCNYFCRNSAIKCQPKQKQQYVHIYAPL